MENHLNLMVLSTEAGSFVDKRHTSGVKPVSFFLHTIIERSEGGISRRDTRVSKTFAESHRSDGARHCMAMSACPSGLSRSDWG